MTVNEIDLDERLTKISALAVQARRGAPPEHPCGASLQVGPFVIQGGLPAVVVFAFRRHGWEPLALACDDALVLADRLALRACAPDGDGPRVRVLGPAGAPGRIPWAHVEVAHGDAAFVAGHAYLLDDDEADGLAAAFVDAARRAPLLPGYGM